jgi:hypothetical protein
MFVVYVFCAFAFLVAAIVFVSGRFAGSRRRRSALLDAQRDNDELRRKTGELESELVRLGADQAGKDLENAELRKQLEAVDFARARLESQAAELRAETTTADSVIRNLSDEHRLRQEAENAHAEVRGILERTSLELDQTRRLLETERKERGGYEQSRALTSQSLRRLEAERDRLASCLTAAEREAQRTAAVEKELAAASREVGETRRLLAQERAERVRTDQKHAAACNSLRELEAERQRLEQQLKATRNALHELELERSHSEQKHAATRNSLRELETQRAHSEQQLAAARISLQELEAERAKLLSRLETRERKARASDVLERELSAAYARTADLEQLQTDHANLRQTHQAEHDELCELKSRLADTSSRCRSEQAKAIATDALYQDAMQRWTVAEAELRDLRTRALGAESRVAELQRNRQENASNIEDNQHLVALETRAALAQADLHEARIRLQASEARLTTFEQLRAENLALREEGRDITETAQKLAAAQAEVRELRAKLQALAPKLEELERIGEENRSLREQVAELAADRDAADVLERMTAEHKRLRLESELMTRRLQELEGERMELFELRARVQELSTIADEVSDLRRHEAELEAQLFSTIRHSQTIPGVETGGLHTLGEVDATPDAESVLCSLVGPGRARSAALADGLGLLVAGAGERELGEGLAAFAGLAGEMADRARTLLPIGQMVRVSISAANDVKVSCRFFLAGGIEYGLATIATGTIEGAGDERAIDTLAGVLSTEHAERPESAAS